MTLCTYLRQNDRRTVKIVTMHLVPALPKQPPSDISIHSQIHFTASWYTNDMKLLKLSQVTKFDYKTSWFSLVGILHRLMIALVANLQSKLFWLCFRYSKMCTFNGLCCPLLMAFAGNRVKGMIINAFEAPLSVRLPSYPSLPIVLFYQKPFSDWILRWEPNHYRQQQRTQ